MRPDAPDANSLSAIASHAIGAAEEHVRGWALGQDLGGELDGFADSDVAGLRERLAAATERLRGAFAELDAIADDAHGMTGRGPQPVFAILHWAVLHAAEHAGAAELTRDLLLASRTPSASERSPGSPG